MSAAGCKHSLRKAAIALYFRCMRWLHFLL